MLINANTSQIYQPVGAMNDEGTEQGLPKGKPFLYGGQSGIRTHGTLTRTPVFKTGALNRSAICPRMFLAKDG